jgi:hypothetical protein
MIAGLPIINEARENDKTGRIARGKARREKMSHVYVTNTNV